MKENNNPETGGGLVRVLLTKPQYSEIVRIVDFAVIAAHREMTLTSEEASANADAEEAKANFEAALEALRALLDAQDV
jgi:hypothetical protein